MLIASMFRSVTTASAFVAILFVGRLQAQEKPGPLPNTQLLEQKGDIASDLVDGVQRFLEDQTDQAVLRRRKNFEPDTSSIDAYLKYVEPKRERLAKILGVVDPLEPFTGFQFQATSSRSAAIKETKKYTIRRVRWPVVRGVHGEGLLIDPVAEPAKGGVIVVPHATQSPEAALGVESKDPMPAVILANVGMRVLIPTIIDYDTRFSKTQGGSVETGITHREFCYRPAFELGRHLLGYEVQKVIAAARGLLAEGKGIDPGFKVAVYGEGEGGLIGIYAGALSSEIAMVNLIGRDSFILPPALQPISRNVFGLHEEFGLAELAMLIPPRKFGLSDARFSSIPFLKAGGRGAPVPGLQREHPATEEGKAAFQQDLIDTYTKYVQRRPVEAEIKRWKEFVPELTPKVLTGIEGELANVIEFLGGKIDDEMFIAGDIVTPYTPDVSYQAERMKRQVDEILDDTQFLLEESPFIREKFWAKTQPARAARSGEQWLQATESYREYFSKEVIGRFYLEKLPPKPRTRLAFEEPTYTGYEVVLDVYPNVIAYGLLLVPKGIKDAERRPVVVAQHGLEGRPQDLADPKIKNPAYNQFGCRLAERGFIVFAPQNLYIFHDRFRVLQRQLNPLGKTLFSIIIPQHEQIVAWLATLPFVDAKRIGFYGLSYGGKSAMRIPAVVKEYSLSICSADFNDWIWKNASLRSPYSYIGSPEYEIFEFDLGMTFNYSEMAGLICPRPFMVERGHRDGVAPDDRVAAEFAKVRQLYVDLHLADRTEIEFFDGPHTIHGVGTFAFLHKHLDWPSPTPPTPLEAPSK
ncbi:hypothetical protein K2X85_16510 [bacterium]|nr:hypothetical protein [bacterium]